MAILWLQFYYSKRLQIRTKVRHPRVRSGRVWDAKFPCSKEIRYPPSILICANTQVFPNKEIHLSSSVQNFYCFLTRHDWLNVVELTLQCPHMGNSSNPLLTWMIFLVWPAPILSHLFSINYLGAHYESLLWCKLSCLVWSRGATMNNKDMLLLCKFKWFRGYLPCTRDKGQPFSSLHCSQTKFWEARLLFYGWHKQRDWWSLL